MQGVNITVLGGQYRRFFQLAHIRREKILELLREDGSGKVLDLARIFKVTEVTIRQDLEKLEKEGWVIR